VKKAIVSAGIFFLSVVIFIGLYSFHLLNSFALFGYIILLLILLQAIIISYRYLQLINTNQILKTELTHMNDKLERIVEERTKELHEKNGELADLEDNRTKMLANIAHDLGPPIVGIQTYLHLMREGLVHDSDEEVLKQLYEKTDYVKRLIDDLFELSKLESKELSFQMEYVLMKDFIQDAFSKFEADLRHENRILLIEKCETIVRGQEAIIKIDPVRLMQVMQNFISNAVKFNNSHEDQPITLNCYIPNPESMEKEICVEVIDRGVGIAPEELPQVFNRFYKKQEGNKNGSGLGLPISKEIIEQHGGYVGVESKINIGSKFYFNLPYFLEVELPHDDSLHLTFHK
jgi:signal transduction histidine kinase